MLSEKAGTNKRWPCAQSAHYWDVMKTSHVLREWRGFHTRRLSRI